MKSMILAGVATLALGAAAAQAQNAPAAAASDNAQFINTQAAGEFRAPKLVGVAVYDSANKSVGKISDLLLDKQGEVKAVVISVGGFLGVGSKYVAVPFSALSWQTEQRTAAVNSGDPANRNASGTANGAAPAGTNRTATVDPAQTEAYQGYPDRAVIAMSQEQLKSAPEFKYADTPAATTTSGSANGGMMKSGTTGATKP